MNDFASVGRRLADAQNALGHHAVVLSRREIFVDEPDIALPPRGGPVRDNVALLRHWSEVRSADVVHIHGGIRKYQLVWPAFRSLLPGKVYVAHLHGSETRRGTGTRYLKFMHRVLASTPDLVRLIPRAHWIPNPVIVPKTQAAPPHARLVVGHFPTDRRIKGTERIVEAFQSLGDQRTVTMEPGVNILKTHDAELLLVEGVPHRRALELMAGCDIVIDQVNDLGIYSLVSVEAMALGKAAASSYDPSLYPEPPPILRIDAHRLPRTLRDWIASPEEWRSYAERGGNYARRVHDPKRIATQVLRVYQEVMNQG